ncbi:AIPR family protein [Blastococcus sp. SYSU D00813]
MVSALEEFGDGLVQDVLATAEATDVTLPDAFTQRMIEHLTEAGELDDGLVCYHRARGVEVSGYAIAEDESRVDVFITHFRHDVASPTLPASELETLSKRLKSFITKCRNGYRLDVDDSSPVFDMVQDIERTLKAATSVRFFLFTNATTRVRGVRPETVDGIEYNYNIWDIARLHRLLTSGTLHEPIMVDFAQRFGAGLPCLSTPVTDTDYSALLTIVPGPVLASLYDEFGTRLLELNVRSFLQTKGAVNKGIRESILKTPERFLAYNNGISATASRVEFSEDGKSIIRLHDLQIVNGGQTTASVHSAVKRDGADVSSVFVQAKVTVVSPEKLDEIVPQISKYSNTQNKVTTADFSANNPFHVDVEKLSRAVWAPSPTGDGQETRWFYERARGQYADELARQRTPARQKAFKLSHPTKQKFTKTDLAKFVTTWEQLPHLVSRGAEKNFREFMDRMATKSRPRVDEVYFKRMIAQAILFRETERIVSGKNFGGYRANIVTYTIAKLANATATRIDLDDIWRRQGLSPALESAISSLCVPVQASITNPPRAANIGEWCKRPEAWTAVEAIKWATPAALADELVDLRARRVADAEAARVSAEASAEPTVASASAVPADAWFECAHWAKQTNALAPWQRGLAFSLGQRASRAVDPSPKQAVQGIALMQEALRLGFRPQVPLPASFDQDHA